MYSKCIRRRFENGYIYENGTDDSFFRFSIIYNKHKIYICMYILRANECTSLEIVLCKIYTYT